MCKMKAPKMPAPPPPAPMRSVAKDPEGGRTGIARREGNRLRSGSNTILTSGLGVLESAQTQLKTLLGG